MGKAENQVLRAITDLLDAERILWHRIQSGAVKTATGGYMRFSPAGTADLICFPKLKIESYAEMPHIVYVEAKTDKGKQSPSQIEFQQRVEAYGTAYILARSSDDVLGWLKARGYRR